MNKIEIITVATHDDGNFNELINNKFNEKIKVLGYGQKWYGFKMKYDLLYNYLKEKDDDTIIIFLDGFDTVINKDPKLAIKIFKENNYKILFSQDWNNVLGSLFFSNSLYDNSLINSGMYMGYVKYLKKMYNEINNYDYMDDQVLLNKLKHKIDYIDVDDNKIFKNFIYSFTSKHETDAIFYQTPGKLEINRTKRAIKEYGNFFNNYILLLNAIILFIFYKIKKNIVFIIYLIFTIGLFIYLYHLPKTHIITKINV